MRGWMTCMLCVAIAAGQNNDGNGQQFQQPQQQQQQPLQGQFDPLPAVDEEVLTAFNPDVYDGYQRRMTIEVPAKKEECFFIENVQTTHKLNFHFMVVNVDKNGRKLDISTKIKDPDSRVINFQSRKVEGKLIGEAIEKPGDYEICFNNRFSMFEPKRVFWEVEVEGAVDEAREEQLSLEEAVDEYTEQAKIVKKAVSKVRTKVSRMRHQQWRVEQNNKRDTARADAIQDMIDRWSVIHVFAVVVMAIAQVVILRRFFSMQPGKYKMAARA